MSEKKLVIFTMTSEVIEDDKGILVENLSVNLTGSKSDLQSMLITWLQDDTSNISIIEDAVLAAKFK